MNEEAKKSLLGSCQDVTPRDQRNQRRYTWSLAAWGLAYVGVTFAISRELVQPGLVGWGLALLPTLLAVVAVLAYARFLSEADELERIIHYRALALGFAAGWIAMVGYSTFGRLGAPPVDGELFTMPMIAVYALSIFVGKRRYA